MDPSRIFFLTNTILLLHGDMLGSIIPLFNMSSICSSTTGFNACGILYGFVLIGNASPVSILSNTPYSGNTFLIKYVLVLT
jgi:hypothetical protein